MDFAFLIVTRIFLLFGDTHAPRLRGVERER